MRRGGRRSVFVAVVVALTAAAAIWLGGSGDAPAAPAARPAATTSTLPTTEGTGSPAPDELAVAASVVDTLVVAEVGPDLAPYRRDAFGSGWDYDPASGCNIRELVLIEEAIRAPDVDDRCRSTNGQWVSAYDGVTVDDVADLQIDHFVPLADAWRSGAAHWTDARREAFSNDLTHPETLIAVTGFTNQSKSDRTPDEWLPPDRTAWCTYASDWVSVKSTWSLSVTPAEKATLVQVLSGC